MYKLIGGDLSQAAWEKKVYSREVEGAKAAAKAQAAPTTKAKGDWPTMTQDVQDAVDKAVAKLRKDLGKTWLEPKIYGTRLHAELAKVFPGMKLPPGWTAVVEQPLRTLPGVDQAVLPMTVREFVKSHIPEHEGLFSETLLNRKIGNIIPDLVLIGPDGRRIIWDLAPSSAEDHLAKTILYAHVAGGSGRTTIGETVLQMAATRGHQLDQATAVPRHDGGAEGADRDAP